MTAAAPDNGKWYPLELGPTYSKESSTQYILFRYNFKPPLSGAGSFHKGENREVVTELAHSDAGKPSVVFRGHADLCQDHDGMLFFDGEKVRLEQMHQSVILKREGTAAAAPRRHLSPHDQTPEGHAVVGTTSKALEDAALEKRDEIEDEAEHTLEPAGGGKKPSTKRIAEAKAEPSKGKSSASSKKRKDLEPKHSPKASPSPAVLASSTPEAEQDEREARTQKKPRPEDVETIEVGMEEEVVEYYETDEEEEEEEAEVGGEEERKAAHEDKGVDGGKMQVDGGAKSSSESGSTASGSDSGSDASSSGSGSEDEEESASLGDDL